MHGVGQQNDVGIRHRVDPHRSSSEAGVAKAADRQQFAAIGRERRFDIPAKTAQNGCRRRLLRGGQFFDGGGRDYEFAIEHGLRKARQVIGGREHAGVSGDAAHGAGGGVVDHAAKHAPVIIFGGRNGGNPTRRRQVAGAGHRQRLENMLRRILFERQARELLDQLAEHDEIDIGVAKAGAGGGDRLLPVRQFVGRLLRCPLRRGKKIQILAQAREVGQQLAHRNLLLAVGGKAGKPSSDRIVQA